MATKSNGLVHILHNNIRLLFAGPLFLLACRRSFRLLLFVLLLCLFLLLLFFFLLFFPLLPTTALSKTPSLCDRTQYAPVLRSSTTQARVRGLVRQDALQPHLAHAYARRVSSWQPVACHAQAPHTLLRRGATSECREVLHVTAGCIRRPCEDICAVSEASNVLSHVLRVCV